MTSFPPRGFPCRELTWLACAVALAAASLSCGRSLPSAPAQASVPAGTGSALAKSRAIPEYLDEVAVLPAKGVNVRRLAEEYGAQIAPGSNYICVRFLPADGESPEQLASRLMADSRVIAAERNAVIETAETRQESYASDDGFGSLHATLEQPAVEALGFDRAHRVSDGNGIRVAVLDTGADPTHRWLRHRIAEGVDYVDYDDDFTDVRDGVDGDDDGRIDEAYGHGTHVAGIVAIGAPRARLLVVRVLDADGRGDIAAVTAGLRWAIDHGARVINLSLGMLHPSRCIEYLLESAEAAGVIVVASAGNWGAEMPIEYPASSPRVIAVAATDAFAAPAPFTSFGRHIALGAPGIGVRSAYPGGGWRLWSGTSMSAPFVSGTAALLKSVHGGWTRGEVVARLSESARPLVGASGEQAGKLGSGMLHAGRALAADGRLHGRGGAGDLPPGRR
jgi:hypothetical protein